MAIVAGAAIAAVGVVGAAAISANAASKQAGAIKKGALSEKEYRAEVLNFAREQYDAGKPLRDIQEQFAQFGVDILPMLKEEIANPTFSEGYKLASKEGLDQLQKGFATSGDPGSGPAQIAAGRFEAGLTAAERDRHVDNLFRAAGFGSNAGAGAASASASAVGAYGLAGRATDAIAGLGVQGGAVQAGLYGNIGNGLANAGGQIGSSLINYGMQQQQPAPSFANVTGGSSSTAPGL